MRAVRKTLAAMIIAKRQRPGQSLLTGRSNIFIHSSSWVTPILLSEESKVKDTSRVVRMPAGPVHDYPASNSQGLGIPKNARARRPPGSSSNGRSVLKYRCGWSKSTAIPRSAGAR